MFSIIVIGHKMQHKPVYRQKYRTVRTWTLWLSISPPLVVHPWHHRAVWILSYDITGLCWILFNYAAYCRSWLL